MKSTKAQLTDNEYKNYGVGGPNWPKKRKNFFIHKNKADLLANFLLVSRDIF